jgi:hypothetical protein
VGVLFVAVVLGVACSDDGAPSSGEDGTAADDGGDASVSASATGSTAATATLTDSGGEATGTGASTLDGSSGGGTGVDDGPSGSTGGGVPGMGCVSDDDCTIVDDCCTCAGIHVDDEPPACPIECKATACMSAGLGQTVHCELGTCQLEEVDCNQMTIVCDSLPPNCEPGFLPSVGNNCWTGNCVPVEACNVVPSCDVCPEDQTCIELVAKGPGGFKCSPIAPECAGTPTCDCMPGVCPPPFEGCIDIEEGIRCECLAC